MMLRTTIRKEQLTVFEKIVQLKHIRWTVLEEIIKGQIRELVRNIVEELEAEALQLTNGCELVITYSSRDDILFRFLSVRWILLIAH